VSDDCTWKTSSVQKHSQDDKGSTQLDVRLSLEALALVEGAGRAKLIPAAPLDTQVTTHRENLR